MSRRSENSSERNVLRRMDALLARALDAVGSFALERLRYCTCPWDDNCLILW